MNSPLRSNTTYIEHFSMRHYAYNLFIHPITCTVITHIIDMLPCKILLKQCAEIQN